MTESRIAIRILALLFLCALFLVGGACAYTTSVHIVKYANDGTTILNETNITYQEMMATLPVLGDGVTHYYHQGPVFVDDANETLEQELRWNPAEDTNVDTKDMGAVKGSNLKDLCDLVGGMSPGEQVKLLASDGWSKWFAYDNVYEYSSREGPIGICWYKNGQYPDSGYTDGMRMVWFADTSVNPWGFHAFGNYDWHEAAAPEYWYYYIQGTENYPTTTGLSGQVINRIYIYSDEAPPVAPVAAFNADVTSGDAPLTVHFTDQSTGDGITDWAWDFTNDGTVDSTEQSPSHVYDTAGTYTVNLTVTNAGGSDSEVKTDYIAVSAPVLWNLNLSGVSDYTMPNTEFEALAVAYPVSWTDTSSNVWSGVALWRLLALVDDSDPATLNDTFAAAGYKIQIMASDGFSKQFNSADIARNDSRIIANLMNGAPLAQTRYPLRFVGPGLSGAQMVSKIVSIDIYLPITASAGTGGSIEPSGAITIPYDDSQVFNIMPDTGYHISDVLVDGASVGAVTSYTFDDVTSSHTINASFAANGPAAPVAAFTSDVQSGTAPLTVTFTDQSTGTIDSWAWDFEDDGIIDDTMQNPSYDYDTAGTYTVNLTVTNAAGSDSEVKTGYITVTTAPTITELFNGTVTLTPGTTFSQVAYNSGTSYTINETTPLGALHATGLPYDVTDKRWASDQVLLIDNVSTYTKAAGKWYAYVSDIYKDGYMNHPNGLNVIQLADGDRVEFYFASGISDPTDLNAVKAVATAAVKTIVDIPTGPSADVLFDGNVTLNPGTFSFTAYNTGTEYQIDTITPHGALDAVSKLVGFVYNGTDKKWATMGTMLLDDVGVYRYDSSITPKHVWAYAVNGVKKNDFSSTEGISVYRLYDNDLVEFYYGDDGDIIDNAIAVVRVRVHIIEQDVLFDGDVTLLPGTFNFTAYNSGTQYQVHTITPHGALDVASKLAGLVYNATDKKWSAMGTMLLDDVGVYRYNSSTTPKHVWAYAVNGVKMNDYSAAEGISAYTLQNNDRVVFYYGDDGDVQANATAVVRIRVHVASTDNWTLTLKGAQTIEVSKQLFEEGISCIHNATYTDVSGTWEGMPLWDLAGYVDDAVTHGPGAFNDTLAAQGYQIKVIASDGYNKTFSSVDVARNSNYIIANKLEGQPLPITAWPLRLVGANITPSNSVAQIVTIELIGVPSIEPSTESPTVHIIKYGSDGTTIINETTVSYEWMEEHLAVIGDGVTPTKFQGITMDPEDLWSPTDETKGGFKISNIVKGTRIHDLVELVGGMGSGTDVTLVARDNYSTILPYSSIYTNPAVQEHQGDAILAWWGDGSYVPDYVDGMRVFFMPDDHIYGQWDMHESLPDSYWHYYYQSYPVGSPYAPGIMFPSAAGLSGMWITTIEVYSTAENDWTLELDGRDIGGINYSVSKTYLEQALACQFGSNHKAEYTDSKGNVWEGMPLWFMAGFVDDADQHSDNAFNDALALAGYDVVITGSDGASTVIDSKDIIRNANYIVANSLNGSHIPDDSTSWPLRLVGPSVAGASSIKGIEKIELVTRSESQPILAFQPEDATVFLDGTQSYTLVLNEAPTGVSGYNVTISLTNGTVATLTSLTFPNWASVTSSTTLPGDSVTIKAADLMKQVQNGMTNITLATFTVTGDEVGSAQIQVAINAMDDDTGAVIDPTTEMAAFHVLGRLVPLNGIMPTDPDGNCLYEDLNGNGRIDFNDVVLYFNYLEVIAATEPVQAFDFNHNGRIDFDDVVELFWGV